VSAVTTHRRIRPFNTRDTYPNQTLDNDLCHAVVANGTVYLLPHSRGGTGGRIISHSKDPETNDLLGYTGDDPGIAVEAPAGSVIAFSSFNLHSSGTNTTRAMRRVYLPQYAPAPLHHSETGEQFNLAVPFVRNGRNIYDHKGDTPENWGGIAPPLLDA